MIGALSVTEFLVLCVFAFAFLWLAVLIADMLRLSDRIERERELEELYERTSYGTQWSGITTQDDQAFLLDAPEARDEFMVRHGVGRRQ